MALECIDARPDPGSWAFVATQHSTPALWVSNNLILAYFGQDVLGMSRSC